MSEVDPRFAILAARFEAAVGLHTAQRLDEAAQAYAAILQFAPRFAPAWSNLGLTFLGRNDPAQALVAFENAIEIDPAFVDARVNCALALLQLGRVEEARLSCDRALELSPGHPPALANRSTCALLLGDLAAGFRDQEARWLVEPNRSERRVVDAPLWLGDRAVQGKTVLLHAEQGFGDTLQFMRYAPMVRAQGARVVLEVQPALKALAASLDGVDVLVAAGEPVPPIDLHCPLMSLPLALGTTLETIPAAAAYLTPPRDRVEAWAARLGPKTRPRIGVAWFGKPTHVNDLNRSIPFAQFSAALPRDAELFSLHDRLREADAPALAARPDLRSFAGEIEDFADTAALVSLMDLVVSVDTATAHLAGALGRPTWVLLPLAPDWRWLLGRDDSPWYPSVRLFRQPALHDWPGALAELNSALVAFVRQART